VWWLIAVGWTLGSFGFALVTARGIRNAQEREP